MPNHVRNVLKFSKLTPKERDFILERFTTEMEDDIEQGQPRHGR